MASLCPEHLLSKLGTTAVTSAAAGASTDGSCRAEAPVSGVDNYISPLLFPLESVNVLVS